GTYKAGIVYVVLRYFVGTYLTPTHVVVRYGCSRASERGNHIMARPKRRQRGERGKPWYRKDRDQWCVTQGKNKVPLRDRHGNFVRGAGNEAQALTVWHEMMAVAQA